MLWAASVFGGFSQSLAGAAGPLLAGEVGGSDAVAGLPQALLVAGSALATVTLSGVASRRRRAALNIGVAAGGRRNASAKRASASEPAREGGATPCSAAEWALPIRPIMHDLHGG